MVRFSRFRTRSMAKPRNDAGNELPPPASSAKSELRILTDRQRELSKAEKELQDIVMQVDTAHAKLGDLPPSLTYKMKQRSTSTKSSSKNSYSDASPIDSESDKEPLWKRRLRRAKHEDCPLPFSEQATSQPEMQPKPKQPPDGHPNNHASFFSSNTRVEQNRAKGLPHTDEGPSDKPQYIYSPVTKRKVRSSPPPSDAVSRAAADNFSLATPSVYTETTNPVSEEDDITSARSSANSTRDHLGRFHDDVSSLGHDEELFYEDDARCSVSSLAAEALNSAAVLLLRCNEGCSSTDRGSLSSRRERRSKR